MKIKSAVPSLLLMWTSISAVAGVTCSDLKYGSESYHESMERLAKEANLHDGYYSRYHEDVVRYLCAGKSREVKRLVDDGDVKASEVEAIKEAIGIKGVFGKGERSEQGQRYGFSKRMFSEMGLCSACADNVAQYYTHKPTSQCGLLAKRALEGNPKAVEELQAFPPYCVWKY